MAILQKAESLEELRLTIDDRTGVSWLGESAEVASGQIQLNHWLGRFSHLRKLTVDVEYLLPFSGPRSISRDYLVTRLPVCLEELTINWDNYQLQSLKEICIALHEYGIWLGVVEALKMLLREAGPGRKFRKLRHLDPVEILCHNKEMRLIVEIGKCNGVQVADHRFAEGKLRFSEKKCWDNESRDEEPEDDDSDNDDSGNDDSGDYKPY
ncbi:hypothetical protein ACHAPO_001275 [Fusarium lateritium]